MQQQEQQQKSRRNSGREAVWALRRTPGPFGPRRQRPLEVGRALSAADGTVNVDVGRLSVADNQIGACRAV